ncbi:MAG: 4-hydroxy-tetrahydrodipicolinate synthase [Xanthomonadales bacterium]|nr:4-hydroxy-tetrahydrodipicolinate synthase [Xanthomonadales bacterium]
MFHGSIPALVTPFTERGEIDFDAVRRLVNFHLQNGSDGLVVAGTTGESPVLTLEEFARLLDCVVEQAAGRIPVLAGTGSASTARAIEQTRLAAAHGAAAALMVTPYYNRPPQRGLQAHYLSIAGETDLPILLYNVPGRTGVDLQPATVARLAEHPGIIGIKEAVPETARVDELLRCCGTDFIVLSGDDQSCLAAMKHGARGVISVAANVAPDRMSRLCAAAARADWVAAEALENALRELFGILMIESNPIPVKWLLFEMKLIGPALRLPLTQLDTPFRNQARDCLSALGLTET